MPPPLQRLAARIDAYSLRERGLLLLAAVAVLVGLWQVLLFGPLHRQQVAQQRQIRELNGSIATLNHAITAAAERQSQDPNVALRTRLAAANAADQALDRQLRALTAGLISPQDMARVLEQVLKAQHGLTLVSAASLPAEPVTLAPGRAAQGADAHIYRHGLTLTFDGSYLDTLRYLQALAGLPWHFYWDRLELRVKTYPVSRVSLTVHTLNLKEGWLGV